MKMLFLLFSVLLLKSAAGQTVSGIYVNKGDQEIDTLYLNSDSTFRLGIYTVNPGVDEAILGTWELKNEKILLYTGDDTKSPALKAIMDTKDSVTFIRARERWMRSFLKKEFVRDK